MPMETLIKVAQLILSLSILVTIHEFGHYITARMFKTRVEKFYLFFDFLFPFPNLLNFALFKKKIGETEYGIGWFPLGGYVKIAGMIDESMDEEFLKSPPQPWEFRSKKPYQRLIIMLGGIIFNVILAFFVYSFILYHYGQAYIPAENAKYGFAFDSTAHKMGLRDGDKIISYDGGKKLKLPPALVDNNIVGIDLLIHNAKTIQVERDGKQLSFDIPTSAYREIMANKEDNFAVALFPCTTDSVMAGDPLARAGGKSGDQIIQLDSTPISYYNQFRKDIQQYKGKQVALTVLRDTNKIILNVTTTDSGLVGFFDLPEKHFKIIEEKYGIFASIPAGVKMTYEQLRDYIEQVRIIFNPELKGYKQVGSFITIAQQFSPKWDWYRFWKLTAFLSLALAFANLLPIPGLDGGHALFTLVEMITGRAPSDKFLERAQVVGMIIIFALMFFALRNDIVRVFFGGH
jgi:regulator of sigma E protease